MKSLDEVIKALEICTSGKHCQDECPYASEECPTYALEKDALYYLKHLQEYYEIASQKSLIALHKMDSVTNIEGNEPLTWEELERMEGKPVWVQWNGPGWMRHSTWVIVISAHEKGMSYCTKEEGAGVGFDGYLLRQPYGTGWSAYRKEPA